MCRAPRPWGSGPPRELHELVHALELAVRASLPHHLPGIRLSPQDSDGHAGWHCREEFLGAGARRCN